MSTFGNPFRVRNIATSTSNYYPHKHMISGSPKEKKRYLSFKRRILKKFKIHAKCNHCDEIFNKTTFNAFSNSANKTTTKLSYTDFTENVTLNRETAETANCRAAQGSNATVYKVTHLHQISETVKYNVTSHRESSETVSCNVARPQSTGTANISKKHTDLSKQKLNPYIPKHNLAAKKNSGMTNVTKTNPDLRKQQPGTPKDFPKKDPGLPKPQLGQIPIMQPNLTRRQRNYIQNLQTVSARPFEVALLSGPPPNESPRNKLRNRRKQEKDVTRTVYYKGQAGATVDFKPPDEPNVVDLTDQEMPLEKTQQHPLAEIKINIANKPSSSKTKTVTEEGGDRTTDKVPEATTSQQENTVQEDTSTVEQAKNTSAEVVTDEKPKEDPQPKAKPKSANKPPFFVQTADVVTDEKPEEETKFKRSNDPLLVHTIPNQPHRFKDNMSANPGYSHKPTSNNFNINKCLIQTIDNSPKQTYVSSFPNLIEDPVSSFCQIHKVYNCPWEDKRTLRVITPTDLDAKTQQISKEMSHQSQFTSLEAGYQSNVKEIVPQIPQSHPQESHYQTNQTNQEPVQWNVSVRAGVPMSFNNRMMGERLAPPDHDVPQRGQDIVHPEGDSRAGTQWIRHSAPGNQEVVFVDSDSDWEDQSGVGSLACSNLPNLLLSVYCNPSDDPEPRKNKPAVRKNTETQSRPCKKRATKTEASDISTTAQEPIKYVPILERSEIVCSMDATVKSLVKSWPWEKYTKELLSVTYDGNAKQSKIYKNIVEESKQVNPSWTKVTITGYPQHWDRHKLLDTFVNWREMSSLPLTPCFVEFNSQQCKFLVAHNERALYALYDRGLVLHDDDFRLNLSVAQLSLCQNDLRFRLAVYLGYRLYDRYDKAKATVDLTAFLREQDISMMCHFPLSKLSNQQRILEVKTKFSWRKVTTLILAKNFLTTLDGFNFQKHLPALKELDLSDNLFTSSTELSRCRGMLSVKSVRLEGNPLCLNFVHQDEYIEVVLLIFPMVDYLDGVKISGVPEPKKNFCPYPEAQPIVDRFMELYFNLLESKSRSKICAMYSPGSVFTLACQSRLKKLSDYENLEMVRACRDVRLLNEMMDESFVGNEEISQRLASWPPVSHDLDSFTVDVMLYTNTSIIFTVTGCLRVQIGADAADCPLLDFSRTFVLSSRDGTEYVINNDLWYLAESVHERKNTAFQIDRPKPTPSLQLENAPDEDLKIELIDIVMKLTQLNRHQSKRCLEFRNWDLRCALQYFIELLEVNAVSNLNDDVR